MLVVIILMIHVYADKGNKIIVTRALSQNKYINILRIYELVHKYYDLEMHMCEYDLPH